MMILLTLDEANKVKGYADDRMHALHPIELNDGSYVLPVAVLDDPFHAEHHELLNSLPLIANPLPDDYAGATGADRLRRRVRDGRLYWCRRTRR